MPSYLLPCSCGRTVGVSTSMAGETVRCACGVDLQVPTLRGLRALPQAGGSGIDKAGTTRAWTDRHRVTFVLAVAALAAGAVAAYLAVIRPQQPTIQLLQTGPSITESTPAEHVYAAFDELQKGISPKTNIITPQAKEAIEQRTKMMWGIRIALGLGACALVAAVASALLPGGRG